MILEAIIALVLVATLISNSEETPKQRRSREAQRRKNRQHSRWYD